MRLEFEGFWKSPNREEPRDPHPLLFLFLASLLFILAHSQIWFTASPKATRPLMPVITLNIIGLSLTDASFYQVARGLVLPLIVPFSTALSIHTLSCVLVTTGFFTRISTDSTPLSTAGTAFSPSSSKSAYNQDIWKI